MGEIGEIANFFAKIGGAEQHIKRRHNQKCNPEPARIFIEIFIVRCMVVPVKNYGKTVENIEFLTVSTGFSTGRMWGKKSLKCIQNGLHKIIRQASPKSQFFRPK